MRQVFTSTKFSHPLLKLIFLFFVVARGRLDYDWCSEQCEIALITLGTTGVCDLGPLTSTSPVTVPLQSGRWIVTFQRVCADDGCSCSPL
ncbi:hypothetical protein BJX76DRAFT_337917 [Aspergillus varians]